jgi:long-chain acyl-CoA synthetase
MQMPRGASRNAGRHEPPADVIVRAFDRRVARSRDTVLVRSAAWRATRGDIHDWSHLAASRVGDAGLPPGTVVGLLASQAPAFLAGFIGLRRQGCTALLLDDTAPDDDRARVCGSIGARAVLRCEVDTESTVMQARLTPLDTTAGPVRPDWAVIKMTSGSTGQPRGVAVTAEALLADEAALASTMGIREDDRLVAALPLSHSYGFSTLALAALVRGVQLLVPADEGPFGPLRAAHDGQATVFPTVPAYLQALLRMSQPPAWPDTVRLVITAGAPLTPEVARRFRDVTGRSIHVFYGSSECGGICYDRTGKAGEHGTVGTPIDGVTIALSPVNDTPKTGLLSVRSAAVADTYVPAADSRLADGQFQTADLAAWRDGGEVALLGRVDRTINVRGFKVSPAEVEQVLAGLAGVDEALVLDVPGPDGVGTIVRAVVACRDGSLNAASVSAWCRSRLAEHKIPRSIVLVDALPRTSRGKIDRDAVAALPGAVPRHG